MKKFLLGCCLLITVGLLAGCVSVPIGDSVLEISTDGVEFVPGDNSDTNQDNPLNVESDVEDEPEGNMGDMEEPEEFADNENSEEPEESTNNEEASTITSDRQCDEQDYSEVTNNIDVDFHIPECAILLKVTKGDNRIDASLNIEDEDWKTILEEYRDYFGDEIYSENVDLGGESAELKADFSDGHNADIRIYSREGYVELWFRINKPE